MCYSARLFSLVLYLHFLKHVFQINTRHIRTNVFFKIRRWIFKKKNIDRQLRGQCKRWTFWKVLGIYIQSWSSWSYLLNYCNNYFNFTNWFASKSESVIGSMLVTIGWFNYNTNYETTASTVVQLGTCKLCFFSSLLCYSPMLYTFPYYAPPKTIMLNM